MRNIVNPVIDVARPDANPDAPVPEHCDLDRLVEPASAWWKAKPVAKACV